MIDLSQLSSRVKDTVRVIIPKIDIALASRSSRIDLATADNWLLRPELREIYKSAVQNGISSESLSYSYELGGDADLRDSLATFLNQYLYPSIPILPEHTVATPGATHCLDALLTTICNEGDGVLVPVPYWTGFNLHFQLRARVKIIPVKLNYRGGALNERSQPLSQSLLPALSAAFETAPENNPIKALVMTNPHNPLGQCYPEDVLRECVEFCRARRIHYISDELYALSQIGGTPFVSALSLPRVAQKLEGRCASGAVMHEAHKHIKKRSLAPEDAHELPAKRRNPITTPQDGPLRQENDELDATDAAMVHVIWSTSKDLCSSGLRMAVLVSQLPQSRSILLSVALLSSMHLSSLSSLFTIHLLRSPRFPDLVSQLSSRLCQAHKIAAARFRQWGTPFITPDAGPFVLVRLGKKEEEDVIMRSLDDVGVLVAPGATFGGSSWYEEDGGFWARITVAVPREVFWDGLHKIELARGY